MLFTHPYLPWLLTALAVLLLLWLTWRRPNRKRLTWRLLASIVAGISIMLILFPPATKRAITPGTAILLTEGYHPDTLQALVAEANAKPLIYNYKTETEKATAIRNFYTFRQQHPDIQTLHVLGYGLEEEELEALEGISLRLHLTEAPAGVSSIYWPESITLGEAVEVSGKYKHQNNQTTKLYLQAAGQLQDSVTFKTDSLYTFRLSYTPKQEGRFSYYVLAKTENKVDTLGQVPAQVNPVQRLSILILASSPQFEFKFLKNHLAGLQHQVAFRSAISKEIYQQEWLNMHKTELNRISPNLLRTFDVVITDPLALQSMSTAERIALQKAATEDGLGVLTIATEPPSNRSLSYFTGFRMRRLSQQDTRTARATWAKSTNINVTAAPYTLVNAIGVTALVEEGGENLLSAYKQAGWGKVAFSLVPQTFPWQLEGKKEVYASYWAHLLSAISKPEVKEKYWQLISPAAPQTDKPLKLLLTDYTLDASAVMPVATISSLTDTLTTNLPLAQNPLQQEKFTAAFWPRHTGWHIAQTSDAKPYYFFVQHKADWAFESIHARLQATQAFATKQSMKSAKTDIAFQKEPVPVFWFFLLFVLSSGFLWLEEKF